MRPLLAAIPMLWTLTGCGDPELSNLERDHEELRARVSELREHVDGLRAELIEAGVVDEGWEPPAAKRKGSRRKSAPPVDAAFGNPLPQTELSEALPVTVTRTGTPPTLPDPGPFERLDSPCGHQFVVRELRALSDFPLNNNGFGKSGPVLLLEDGRPLKPHAAPSEFEDACSGAFRHAGHAFLFSPTASPDGAESRTWSLALSDDVPLRRGDDGREMYWVYPGTTLTFELGSGWDPAWGPLQVHIAGRIANGSTRPARVQLDGRAVELPSAVRPMPFTVSEVLPPPEGPWTLEITSPEDGPYVILGTLTLGNEGHARVLTSQEAFAARSAR